MPSATTEQPAGSTILTAAEAPPPQATETQLFPGTPTGEAGTEKTPEQKAADEKAVADKAASDKAAADKAVADKTAADKAVADKAAADKAAAEKAAADAKTPPEQKPPTDPNKPEDKTTVTDPKDYDLKLPDGSLLTPDDLAETLKEVKELGLSKEQAERYLASKDQSAKAVETRQKNAFEQTRSQWKETLAKDEEMGGEKLSETVTLASRAFKALASPELTLWVDKSGLGDYPEFVRLMARVGKIMGEDKLVRGTVGAPPDKVAPETRLYGKTTPDADGKRTS